jgi:hypothetical protein
MRLFIITIIIFILFSLLLIVLGENNTLKKFTKQGITILMVIEAILVVVLIGATIRFKRLPSEYNVTKTEIYRCMTSEDYIYRVWLEDKDGTYFWISVNEKEFNNFTKGDTIELTQKEINSKVNSLK